MTENFRTSFDTAEDSSTPNPLPCFICGKALSHALFTEREDGWVNNQPNNGLAFETRGHYGSTIYDPDTRVDLEIAICDPCVRERWARTREVVNVGKPKWEVVRPSGMSYDESVAWEQAQHEEWIKNNPLPVYPVG